MLVPAKSYAGSLEKHLPENPADGASVTLPAGVYGGSYVSISISYQGRVIGYASTMQSVDASRSYLRAVVTNTALSDLMALHICVTQHLHTVLRYNAPLREWMGVPVRGDKQFAVQSLYATLCGWASPSTEMTPAESIFMYPELYIQQIPQQGEDHE